MVPGQAWLPDWVQRFLGKDEVFQYITTNCLNLHCKQIFLNFFLMITSKSLEMRSWWPTILENCHVNLIGWISFSEMRLHSISRFDWLGWRPRQLSAYRDSPPKPASSSAVRAGELCGCRRARWGHAPRGLTGVRCSPISFITWMPLTFG